MKHLTPRPFFVALGLLAWFAGCSRTGLELAPPAVCGDGVVELTEACDDGELNDDLGPCRTDCTLVTCGDGILDEAEGCDEGESNSDDAPDACRTNCLSAFCGDGVVDSGEGCDEGVDNGILGGLCTIDCVPRTCGDGVLDPGEACDDGPGNSDTEPDACRTTCELPRCGDGVVDRAELCDDGALMEEGRSEVCRPGCDPVVCGDGILDPGEACDDGRFNSDIEPDACRLDCRLARCGDAVVDTDELCDDGNLDDADLCGNGCVLPALTCDVCETDADCGRGVDVCLEFISGPGCAPDCSQLRCGPASECRPEGPGGQPVCVPTSTVCVPCFDEDGDGWGVGDHCLGPDCNDANPRINPGAVEICDDIDNNCNDENDEVCPPDLIVDGETIQYGGDQLHDHVIIRNGGLIEIPVWDGTSTTGCLELQARVVDIEVGSGIVGDGAGAAGEGQGRSGGLLDGRVNTGPEGGAYGGRSGAGPDYFGALPFGTADGPDISMGSNGGEFITEGEGFFPAESACEHLLGFIADRGHGGGCVAITAYQPIRVDGFIDVNGTNGEDAVDGSTPALVDGGGGGSGGGILLESPEISIGSSGRLTARGGRGGRGGTYAPPGGGDDPELAQCIGNGGGGGSGGRIKLFSEDLSLSGRVDVAGGAGAEGPQASARDGEAGTIFP